MRSIGLHLRIDSTIDVLINRALTLSLPIFQCFLVNGRGKIITVPKGKIAYIRSLLKDNFQQAFVHASYINNIAGQENHYVLEREIYLAQQLGFTHIILHPGSTKGHTDRSDAIIHLTQTLDKLINDHPELIFVLENVAHGNNALGGNLQEFQIIREKMRHGNKLRFCIDTAHAFSYGYHIDQIEQHENFIQHLDATMGLDNIVLIHLNDSHEMLGSKLDKHALLGNGLIGKNALYHLIMHPRLSILPVLIESPFTTNEIEIQQLHDVYNWHK